AREHQVDLSASWIIGDSVVDMEAGEAAGCKTIRLTAQLSDHTCSVVPDYITTSIREAVADVVFSRKA
ncbi:MAG: HAD hydrolase-like protein, partial [Rhabdochlamydiaceae bacterium]